MVRLTTPKIKDHERLPLRAMTYQPVARGECQYFKNSIAPLRFVYFPQGDELCCINCAEDIDRLSNEAKGNF